MNQNLSEKEEEQTSYHDKKECNAVRDDRADCRPLDPGGTKKPERSEEHDVYTEEQSQCQELFGDTLPYSMTILYRGMDAITSKDVKASEVNSLLQIIVLGDS